MDNNPPPPQNSPGPAPTFCCQAQACPQPCAAHACRFQPTSWALIGRLPRVAPPSVRAVPSVLRKLPKARIARVADRMAMAVDLKDAVESTTPQAGLRALHP